MSEEEKLKQLSRLENMLAQEKSFEAKMEIKDAILSLKRDLGMVRPPDSPFDCEGCSA